VLRHEAKALEHLADTLDERFDTVADWIFGCKGRVICCGVGKSGHIARKAAGTFSSTGAAGFFLHAAEAVHGDLGMVQADDVVLLYSHSGETDEIVALYPALREIGAKTVLIAGKSNSSAGRLSDIVLETHVDEEACPNNLAPTTSTTAMLALSDALAISVMDRRGFTREDFARFHPSGTLGKRLLLRVSDVMRPLAECAVCGPETPILEVMTAITKAGLGMACVLDAEQKLVGLISDGDLRRHFLSGAPHAKAAEIMTSNPTTIDPDLLAAEALEVFQNLERKIGEMPVTKNEHVFGLLTLKDLLRCGIL
jgi:arabinose-5-phosphate isomerase